MSETARPSAQHPRPTRSALATATGLPRNRGVTFPRVLQAEWCKAWTLTSTRWGVLAAILANGAVALYMAYNARYATQAPAPRTSDLLTLGLVASQLPIITIGVMITATEYSSGGVRSTFLAAPRRGLVLAAQALTSGIAAALTAATTLCLTLLALQVFKHDLAPGFDPLAPETSRMLGGFVLYALTAAVLGASLGSLSRSTTTGLVSALGIVFLLPQAIELLGSPRLIAVLPGWAGALVAKSDVAAAAAVDQIGAALAPWQGYGVLATWTLAALLTALVRLNRTPL
ncbi:MAG: hypothetical protein J0H73_08495 [Salana multivorans]|uniref:hypothetical protein n=1 Tax=Salana multivorans TaxID=120377 RepID=UPI0009604DD7|nr:hypothetical protein [Salana multivorans]MBN8882337.1 hypothetical protein [Salana multivorans]OJX97340.1 MAG: hypothetical protein BGO96_05235 [Micrococcales bacterium 73-15]